MKKRLKAGLSILLSLLLLLLLLPLPGALAQDPYFIAINDSLPELNVQNEPIRVGGVTYLPCTLFDRNIAGRILGVYYAWNVEGQIVTLYAEGKSLEFDIKAGTAFSYDKQKEYPYQAVVRGNLAYVPAASTCQYFGLQISFPITDDVKLQIVRITNGTQVLDDAMYMRVVRQHLDEFTQKYQQENQSGGQTTVTPHPQVPETPDAPGKGSSVYLGVRMDSAQDQSALLRSLAGSGQKAVFFFPVERLAESDELLRELLGRGQRIGLISKGSSNEQRLRNLAEGQRLLEHITRQRCRFVLADGLNADAQQALREAGYLPWSASLSVKAVGRTDAQTYQSVIDGLAKQGKGKQRLLLNEHFKGGTLSSCLRQLREDGYELRSVRETDY